jgi:hypothetical protein
VIHLLVGALVGVNSHHTLSRETLIINKKETISSVISAPIGQEDPGDKETKGDAYVVKSCVVTLGFHCPEGQ